MTEKTTFAIKKFATDEEQANAFEALFDYYGVTNLLSVSEEMGLEFLAKLESGEIRIPREICAFVENE